MVSIIDQQHTYSCPPHLRKCWRRSRRKQIPGAAEINITMLKSESTQLITQLLFFLWSLKALFIRKHTLDTLSWQQGSTGVNNKLTMTELNLAALLVLYLETPACDESECLVCLQIYSLCAVRENSHQLVSK